MTFKEFQRFRINLDVSYEDCQLVIEKILENFDSTIIEKIADIETIYCDILIQNKFKICLHYHEMVGLTVIALTKESEEIAKEVSVFINKNFSKSINEKKGNFLGL